MVEVRWGERLGRTGFHMRLLKKEVGELALQAITSGDISEHSLENLPAAAVNKFSGPEDNREKIRRKQIKNNSTSTNEMLMALRTGGGF